MSTQAATPSFLDSVEINLPSAEDYACVIDGQIAPRFDSLSDTKKAYILSLWRHHQEKIGQRTAGCYRSGSVSQVCDRGKYARAVKHRCGDILCDACMRPKVRLGDWAATRDHEIFKNPCTAIEFYPPPFQVTHREFGIMVKVLLELYHPDALMVDGWNCIRCVVPTESVERKKMQQAWPGKMSVKHMDPSSTYLWAFDGFSIVKGFNADDKAHLRIQLIGHRLVRTIGNYYSPLSPEQLAARKSHNPTKCPICGDHDLIDIPHDQQHQESIEDIESRYEHVDWESSSIVIRKQSLTYNFPDAYRISPTTPAVAASPPPW